MEYSEDHIALASEYALGTLDADERAQVETMMGVDQDFTTIVRSWEFRLGVLNQMVGSVEPPAELWDRIRGTLGLTGPQRAPLDLPEPPPIAPEAQIGEAMASVQPLPDAPSPLESLAAAAADAKLIQLSGRVRSYRNLALAMTAIAAALLAIIGVQVYLPGLGGAPRTQVAEVKPSPTQAPAIQPSAQYVALLQGAAGGPAFILTVDGATKDFTVRKLGAPPIDANKDYELWLISDRLQNRPRSLGVIGDGNFTARKLLASYNSDIIDNATYAVTVEQHGGSPDGVPHSQPEFIGKLIETVPASSASPSPSPSPSQR